MNGRMTHIHSSIKQYHSLSSRSCIPKTHWCIFLLDYLAQRASFNMLMDTNVLARNIALSMPHTVIMAEANWFQVLFMLWLRRQDCNSGTRVFFLPSALHHYGVSVFYPTSRSPTCIFHQRGRASFLPIDHCFIIYTTQHVRHTFISKSYPSQLFGDQTLQDQPLI